MFAELIRKRDERKEKAKALKEFIDSGKNEKGELDPVAKLKMTGVQYAEKIKTANTELNDLGKEIETMEAVEQAEANLKNFGTQEEKKKAPLHEGGDGAPAFKSLGTHFIESTAFKGYKRGMGAGPVHTIDIGAAEIKTLFERGAGWLPESLRTGLVSQIPTRPAPFVTTFIPTQPTSYTSIKYMEETTLTNAAAELSEAAQYAETALALTERSKTVEKIAHFIPVTDEQLEDVGGAEAYVNQRMIFGIQQRLDAAVLTGSINVGQLQGVENLTGIQTQALGSDDIMSAVYKLLTSIRSDGFANPGVIFIAPSKFQTVRLYKTADGIFIYGSPVEAGPERMWGLPLVQTTAGTSTKVISGDFAMYSYLAIRRGLDVQISNSHSDFFIKGKQAIRGDIRCCMVYIRPKAFGVVTGL